MTTNNKPSETALATVSLRALSNYEISEELHTEDMLAELFIPEDKKAYFKSIEARESIKKSLPPGLYAYVIARTKYFDKIYSDSIRNGIKQIVFLGAGYDSRPYRFKEYSGKIKIFELDAKATQDYKRKILSESHIVIDDCISYISLDFESEDFIKHLIDNGYKKTDKTLFIWEGVTFYLSKEAVIQTLTSISNILTNGSRVVFDFQTINSQADLIDTGLKDETIKFGLKEIEIEQFVINFGFKIIEQLRAKEIESLFLKLKDGSIFDKISPIMNFILLGKE